MNEETSKIKKRLETQIDIINLPQDQKDRMRRALNAMFVSQNGRLYLERKSDFQEYLTIKKNEFIDDFDFCVVKKMINEQSGSIEGTDMQFPGLRSFASIIEENKDLIDSEIINAENYRRTKEPVTQIENNAEKTPEKNYTESAKKVIEEASNAPEYQKQRAYDVMDLLAEMPFSRIYTERGNNYSEAISLRQTNKTFGYCVVSRTFDEYSGATIKRDSTQISARNLVDYVNEHRITIDKEVKRIKASLPKKDINCDGKSTIDDEETR